MFNIRCNQIRSLHSNIQIQHLLLFIVLIEYITPEDKQIQIQPLLMFNGDRQTDFGGIWVIQIQPLLMFNVNAWRKQKEPLHSNTTLVNVQPRIDLSILARM